MPQEMTHTHLCVSMTSTGELVEHLSIYHCAPCFQMLLTEDVATEEFESTIDIADMDSKYHTNQHFPTPCIEFTHGAILTTYTIAQHRIIPINKREKLLQVVYIELTIRVHKEDQLLVGGLEASYKCGAIALVHSMMDNMQTCFKGSRTVQNDSWAIVASI